MPSVPDVTKIDVRYIADLARIKLTDEEAARYGAQLNAVLAYVAQLRELEVAAIEPMAHATPLLNVMRDDQAGAVLPRDKVLANAPVTADERYIRVPPVIAEDEG